MWSKVSWTCSIQARLKGCRSVLTSGCEAEVRAMFCLSAFRWAVTEVHLCTACKQCQGSPGGPVFWQPSALALSSGKSF